MATPLLTATPTDPPTYNPSMAETFSWVPVQGAGRPLFARTTYLANASDISVSLSAGSLNLDVKDIENLLNETNNLLSSLTATNNPGFSIPSYTKIKNYYYTNTNNTEKVEYIDGSTVVATLSFTYVNNATANDDLLAEVIKL